jgi:hypothetical protein
MMIFSAEQSGQENRITYPALVPFISGINGWFVIYFYGWFVSHRHNHTKAGLEARASHAKKVSKGIGPLSPGILMEQIEMSKPFMLVICWRLSGIA